MNNTYEKGVATLFVYPEENHFIGVCLQLDIIVEADTVAKAKDMLFDTFVNHLDIVKNKKFSEKLLNRPAPTKYWNKFAKLLKEEQAQAINRIPVSPPTLPFHESINFNDILSKQTYSALMPVN